MEPADLNSSSPDDQRLTALLREAQPPIADDGFSTRVLAALPPQTSSKPAGVSRRLVCTAGALVGVAVAWTFGISSLSFETASDQLRTAFAAPFIGSSLINETGIALALVATAASLLYAFNTTPARRS